MKSRTGVALMIAAIACLWASIAGAQAKPNFSGTWKMNPQKSKFAGSDNPSGITIKIDQKDSTISESVDVQDGSGDQAVEAKYTLDGKESDVQLGPNTCKGTAKWEGATLVIEWKSDGLNFLRKHTLSADGKTITMTVRHPSPNGDVDEIVVLEKQ